MKLLFRKEERRRRKIIQRVGQHLTSPVSATHGTVITGITTVTQIQDIPVNMKCCSRKKYFLPIFFNSVFNYCCFESVTGKELYHKSRLHAWVAIIYGHVSHLGSPWPGQEPGHQHGAVEIGATHPLQFHFSNLNMDKSLPWIGVNAVVTRTPTLRSSERQVQ